MWLSLMQLALADCASGGFTAHVDTLPLEHGEIVVDLYGTSQKHADLSGLNPRLVDAEGAQIPLRATAHSVGGYDQRQVVLQVTAPLHPGEWRLALDADDVQREPYGGQQVWKPWNGEATWTATDLRSSPSWSTRPALVEVAREAFGCGPAVNAVIALSAAHAKAWVQVDLDGPTKQSARVQADANGLLTLGHGMCGGTFSMAAGTHVATLTLLGPGGARSKTAHTVDFVVAD